MRIYADMRYRDTNMLTHTHTHTEICTHKYTHVYSMR